MFLLYAPVLALTYDEILGWATIIMDQFGLRDVIKVLLFIVVAFYVYRRFVHGGGGGGD